MAIHSCVMPPGPHATTAPGHHGSMKQWHQGIMPPYLNGIQGGTEPRWTPKACQMTSSSPMVAPRSAKMALRKALTVPACTQMTPWGPQDPPDCTKQPQDTYRSCAYMQPSALKILKSTTVKALSDHGGNTDAPYVKDKKARGPCHQ